MCSLPHNIIDSHVLATVGGLVPFQAKKKKKKSIMCKSYCTFLLFMYNQTLYFFKDPPANAEDERDVSSIPELGRFPRGGNGNPLQYPCLENPMDRGAW